MTKLYSWNGPALAKKTGDRLEIVDMTIIPQAQITMRPSAVCLDCTGFCIHQTSTAHGKSAEMHKVPVIGMSMLRSILAHRRDGDPILECDVAQCEWGEKMSHLTEPLLD